MAEKLTQAEIIKKELDAINECTAADAMIARWFYAGTLVDVLQKEYEIGHDVANAINSSLRSKIFAKAREIDPKRFNKLIADMG